MTKPKKHLSQNFLSDDAIIEKFIDAASLASGDKILEIGPGKGAITKKLLAQGFCVTAIELDANLAKKLSHPNLTLIEKDALLFDYTPYLDHYILSNLPFQSATALIKKLIRLPFPKLTLIVQKEVALRIAASPHTKAYGALTIEIQNLAKSSFLFDIPSAAFFPAPKIDAAAIQLIPHPLLFDLDLDFVYHAFRQRRKMLKNSLQPIFPNIEPCLHELKIDPKSRPENLSLQNFADLYQAFQSVK